MMAIWTSDHSINLSLLLDDVVGTEDMLDIRRDYCRTEDFLKSYVDHFNWYFTGSRAEALDLPGSDSDYMFDIDAAGNIKVIQSIDETPDRSPCSLWFMSVEKVPAGFALLQHVHNISELPNPFLISSTRTMHGLQYLSSDCIADNFMKQADKLPTRCLVVRRRQGPSSETWTEFCDISKPGTDLVLSIHCKFWPNIASEWTQRQRQYGWPNSCDISCITEFGCHLVPVGHPHSETKHMEWRISFSLA